MPPLSTHLRFSSLILPRTPVAAAHPWLFLLGTVAPDSFQPDDEASFAQHHFLGQDGRISVNSFRRATALEKLSPDSPASVFATGYYSHLWLDDFFRDHGDELPVAISLSISDADLRLAVKEESEFLNAPIVLTLKATAQPVPDGFIPPSGLEFVDMQRCTRLLHSIVEQARSAVKLSIKPTVMDAEMYGQFLKRAADTFVLG